MATSDGADLRVTALLSSVLDRFAQPEPEIAEQDAEPKTITLGELLGALDERAFGLGILILSLPCAIPFLYIIPQIVALPMLALAAQLAAGRENPWLPESLANRKMPLESLQTVVRRTEKVVGFFEKLAKPRLRFLSDGFGARVVGALMLIPAASILVPLPSTNSVPAVGVGIASVGLLERDGLLILLGLFIGLAWVSLLLVAAFFGFEAISMLKDMLLSRGA